MFYQTSLANLLVPICWSFVAWIGGRDGTLSGIFRLIPSRCDLGNWSDSCESMRVLCASESGGQYRQWM